MTTEYRNAHYRAAINAVIADRNLTELQRETAIIRIQREAILHYEAERNTTATVSVMSEKPV